MLSAKWWPFFPSFNVLTHWGQVTYICVRNLVHHWFRLWLVAYLTASHYLTQCWNSVNWTLGKWLQWNFNWNSYIFIEENALENVVCKMAAILFQLQCVNTLRPRRNRCHFADDIFKCIFLNENVLNSIRISLKFIPKGPINNIPALVQIMAWHRPGDKPLSEPMMIISLTHICVTRP